MQLITENVWEHISKRANANKNRYVAVAYLGKNASKYLRLESGDVLVVDASESSIKSGSTNPSEIEKYINNGVELYSHENLHSKVFVLGNLALIGSANVSGNSANVLTECMVEFKNAETVSAARGFVRSLMLEPLSPEYVKYLKTIYKPPKVKGNKNNKRTRKHNGNALWVQKLHEYDFTETEQEAYDIGEEKVKNQITDDEKYQIDSVRYKNNTTLAKKAMIGDIIIRVYEGYAYPPSRILGFEKSEVDKSTVILLEEPVNPKTIKESRFISKMEEYGYDRKFRQFHKPDQKNIILGIWKNVHKNT